MKKTKKIYVAHSTEFDFKKELYAPLSNLVEYEFVFPHSSGMVPNNSKKKMKTYDLILAEVSLPSHGVGIELGWADAFGIPILCLYKKGVKISSALKVISNNFLEYHDLKKDLDGVRLVFDKIMKK
jgi:hypothetical protein